VNSPQVKAFIHEHSNLFWYTPEDQKENISKEFLVENILNYGDLEAVKKLINLIGIDKTAHIFFESIQLSERRKANYHELTINFFTLFFRQYAQ
jgi:competence protein ComGF